jgi:hypothetical protein
VSYPIAKYRLRVVQVPDHETNDYMCRVYLVTAGGSKTLVLDDFNISVHRGTGEDIFGDGNTGLVLEGYSGGAHCCWTYSIIDLGERLLAVPDLATNGQAQGESGHLRQLILKVVLSYLYSGREQQAWRELNEMWPASDVQRIKNLILKTRGDGVLSEIGALDSDPQRITPHP